MNHKDKLKILDQAEPILRGMSYSKDKAYKNFFQAVYSKEPFTDKNADSILFGMFRQLRLFIGGEYRTRKVVPLQSAVDNFISQCEKLCQQKIK